MVAHSIAETEPVSDSAPALVIAIDGPASSGKSSTARLLAERLGLKYLDTGMMYRLVAWKFLATRRAAPVGPITAAVIARTVVPLAEELRAVFSPPLDPTNRRVVLGAQDITEAIRSPEVSQVASAIAPFPALRAGLVNWQRAIVAQNPRIVCEGRDVTTQVAPRADLKILLVANASIRQQRRTEETSTEHLTAGEQVALRDRADNRVNALFEPAPGVVKLDNSQLTLEQTVDTILSWLPRAGGKT